VIFLDLRRRSRKAVSFNIGSVENLRGMSPIGSVEEHTAHISCREHFSRAH
jgi:hypothetical protein